MNIKNCHETNFRFLNRYLITRVFIIFRVLNFGQVPKISKTNVGSFSFHVLSVLF